MERFNGICGNLKAPTSHKNEQLKEKKNIYRQLSYKERVPEPPALSSARSHAGRNLSVATSSQTEKKSQNR